jgi:hypothetical protein
MNKFCINNAIERDLSSSTAHISELFAREKQNEKREKKP